MAYWNGVISRLTKATALEMSSRLSPLKPGNVLGVPAERAVGRKVMEFVARTKRAHPFKVLLTRVGDFYEAVGVDAVVLVQFAGLNPMGGPGSCLLYTSPSPRDRTRSRMPSSA